MTTNHTSRRSFLKNSTAAAVAVATLGACVNEAAEATQQQGLATGGTVGPHDTGATTAPATPRAAADLMDAMHEKGVKAFPAKTAGMGNQILRPRMETDVKVFDLTCKIVQWETEPGKLVTGWTYNGVVPGPQIRVREGDRVRVNVKNELTESRPFTSMDSKFRTIRTAFPS